MELQDLIECCLTTDPNIEAGDYTVIFSGSKSGALNAGVLLFTKSGLPKNTIDGIEYRLVSILMMLTDVDDHSAPSSGTDFQVALDPQFKSLESHCALRLINALEDRGIRSPVAHELVTGQKNTV